MEMEEAISVMKGETLCLLFQFSQWTHQHSCGLLS